MKRYYLFFVLIIFYISACDRIRYCFDNSNNSLVSLNGNLSSFNIIVQERNKDAIQYGVQPNHDILLDNKFYFNKKNSVYRVKKLIPKGYSDTIIIFKPNTKYTINGLNGGSDQGSVNITLLTDTNGKVVIAEGTCMCK